MQRTLETSQTRKKRGTTTSRLNPSFIQSKLDKIFSRRHMQRDSEKRKKKLEGKQKQKWMLRILKTM